MWKYTERIAPIDDFQRAGSLHLFATSDWFEFMV